MFNTDRKISFHINNPQISVMFLHAFPLNSKMWIPQFEILEKNGFSYLAIDYPGFGTSKPDKQSMSMEGYAELIYNFFHELGIKKSIFVGSSMGGYIALAILRKYPEIIQGLVLANTRASADDEEIRQRRRKIVSDLKVKRDISEIIEIHLEKFITPETRKKDPHLVNTLRSMMQEATPEGIIQAQEAMAGRKDSLDWLKKFRLPALVIAGGRDEIIPARELEIMADKLPAGEYKIIPEAGHISNLECPEIFNKLLLNFLKRSHII